MYHCIKEIAGVAEKAEGYPLAYVLLCQCNATV